jgi:hypothetical protein
MTANNSPSSPTHHNMKAIVSWAPCSAIASYVSWVDDPNQENDTTLSKGCIDSWKAPVPPLAHQDSVREPSTISQHIHKGYLHRQYPKVNTKLLGTYQGNSSWIGPQQLNGAFYFQKSRTGNGIWKSYWTIQLSLQNCTYITGSLPWFCLRHQPRAPINGIVANRYATAFCIPTAWLTDAGTHPLLGSVYLMADSLNPDKGVTWAPFGRVIQYCVTTCSWEGLIKPKPR